MSTPGGNAITESVCIPTVLVARWDIKPKDCIVATLQAEGCLVLVARDAAEALDIVRVHSRPIHLMLTHGSPEGRLLASTAKEYRRKMTIMYVASNPGEEGEDSCSLEQALLTLRALVGPRVDPRAAVRVKTAAS
jgi:hypothetical protein